MAKVAIIYFTQTDATGALVQAMSQQITELGHSVFGHKILGSEIQQGRFVNTEVLDELKSSDAIIFGSPTYMGGPAAQFKAFADATSEFWLEQALADKVAAGITCGSAPNGDQSSTLQYFVTFSNQHGMLWVGLDATRDFDSTRINPLGCQLGVSAVSKGEIVEEEFLATAKYLGQRVVNVLEKITN